MVDDYEVGYQKTPKHTRFKPGQSGNPAGRPKGRRSLKTDLEDELAERITISESGKSKTISKQRAALKRLVAEAANGDLRALNTLMNLMLKVLHDVEVEEGTYEPTESDKAILEKFKTDLLEGIHTKERHDEQ